MMKNLFNSFRRRKEDIDQEDQKYISELINSVHESTRYVDPETAFALMQLTLMFFTTLMQTRADWHREQARIHKINAIGWLILSILLILTTITNIIKWII